MNVRYFLGLLLILPSLACSLSLNQTGVEPQPTRYKIVRFKTATVTLTPLPSPTPLPPTATPEPMPTPAALPATAAPSPASVQPAETPTPAPSPTPTPAAPQPTSVTQPPPAATATQPPPAVAAAVVEAQEVQAPLTVEQYHLGYGVQLAEAKNMDIAVKGGFTWAKHDLNIRKDINYIANADNLLSDLLHKSGAREVLLKLVVWDAGGLPDAPRSGDEVATFAKNAAKVAEFIRERYGASYQAIAYEIWNEPNLNFEWEGNPNPAEYVALLKATSQAIREADPQAIIVSGAPSPGGDYDDLKFLEGMYANGAKGLMDAVGSHPYGGPWPFDHPTGVDPATGNGYPYFRKAEAQRAIMEKYGDVETQIWATEFSWLAGQPNCDYGEHTAWQVTPQQQAEFLVAAYDYAHHNWPWMGPMFVVYDFAVSGRYDRCHPAAGYSILRPDPNGTDIISPAAQALFAMPKYSAW